MKENNLMVVGNNKVVNDWNIEVHQYSVAKDTRKTEVVIKGKDGTRINIRGTKDKFTIISNKELEGFEYHARKTGSWWGKKVNGIQLKAWLQAYSA